MNAEEFAEFVSDQDWVHQTSEIGEIVVVVAKNRDNTHTDTRRGSLNRRWVEAIHVRKDAGDLYVFVPMEWFTDD